MVNVDKKMLEILGSFVSQLIIENQISPTLLKLFYEEFLHLKNFCPDAPLINMMKQLKLGKKDFQQVLMYKKEKSEFWKLYVDFLLQEHSLQDLQQLYKSASLELDKEQFSAFHEYFNIKIKASN